MSMPFTQPAFIRIFAVSFLLLFAEIMAMRWLGMEIRVLRAFPNLIVIISLVASSVGLLDQKESKHGKLTFAISMIAFLFTFLVALFSQPLHIADLSIKADHPTTEIATAVTLLLTLSACLYILFRLLGKLLGAELSKLEPIVAYSANLLGSIAGALSFMVNSWLGAPPAVWLVVAGGLCWGLYRRSWILAVTTICAVAAGFFYSGQYFSPYSKISVFPLSADVQPTVGKDSFLLFSNNLMFNSGINIDNADKAKELTDETKEKKLLKSYFEFLNVPIAFAPVHDDILILGSGPGNDVAFALKSGAKKVDAVEIDPIIAGVGKAQHPNHPLTDARTHVFTEDARTYLRYSPSKYDLVEFAYLDPGNTVDSASLVRVDNFVYTVESIKSVLLHLKENGVASLVFTCPSVDSFIYQRLYQAVASATGKPPIAYTNKNGTSIIIVFGPGAKVAPPEVAPLLFAYPPANVKITEQATTDNWPFLYLFLEPVGLSMYVIFLFAAVIMPAALLAFSKSEERISKADWGLMFCLGQGFMLMETKSITQLSLLFGATWLVSSIVILFVLIFAFAATMIAASREIKSVGWLYVCLAATLILGFFWQIPAAGTAHPLVDALVTTAIACFPVFFGSLIFSIAFKKATSNTAFLSANLIGVAIGGLTENICIFSGIKLLGIVALVIYGMSYVFWKFGRGQAK